MRARFLVTLPLTMAAGACGLSIVGNGGDGGSSIGDAAPDVVDDVAVVDDATTSPQDAGTDLGTVIPATCAACAAPPLGWTAVAVVAGDIGACPAGAARPRLAGSNLRGSAATCSCTCGDPESNPCLRDTNAPLFARQGGNGDCDVGPGDFRASGTCQVNRTFGSTLNGIRGAPLSAATTNCPGTARPPAITGDGLRTLCDVDLAASADAGACARGEVCLEAPGVCFLRRGDLACPPELPTRTVIGTSDTLVDSRGCNGSCGCRSAATECTGSTFTFYTANSNCTANPVVVPFDGTCRQAPSVAMMDYRFASTPSPAGCRPTLSPPVVGALVVPPHTLCCR